MPRNEDRLRELVDIGEKAQEAGDTDVYEWAKAEYEKASSEDSGLTGIDVGEWGPDVYQTPGKPEPKPEPKPEREMSDLVRAATQGRFHQETMNPWMRLPGWTAEPGEPPTPHHEPGKVWDSHLKMYVHPADLSKQHIMEENAKERGKALLSSALIGGPVEAIKTATDVMRDTLREHGREKGADTFDGISDLIGRLTSPIDRFKRHTLKHMRPGGDIDILSGASMGRRIGAEITGTPSNELQGTAWEFAPDIAMLGAPTIGKGSLKLARAGGRLSKVIGAEAAYPLAKQVSPSLARSNVFRAARMRLLRGELGADEAARLAKVTGKQTGEELTARQMIESLRSHVGEHRYALGEGAYTKYRIGQKLGRQARSERMKPLPKRVRTEDAPARIGGEGERRARAIEAGRIVPRETGGPSLAPDAASPFPMKRSLENEAGVTEPISDAEMIRGLEELLNRPIRVGRVGGGKAGKFKIKGKGQRGTTEVARTIRANDIPTASHEVAHGLEIQFLEQRGYLPGGLADMSPAQAKRALADAEARWWDEMGEVARAELVALDYDPKKARMQEGFAEWFRHYLTIGDHEVVAPHFSRHFDDVFLKYNPDWAQQILRLRELSRRIQGQGWRNELASDIITMAPPEPRKLGDWLKWMGHRTIDLWVDDLAPLQRAEMEMMGGGLAAGAKSPTKIARMVSQAASARVNSWAFDGMTDFSGNLTGPSLREVLEPVAKNGDDLVLYSRARRSLELHARGIPDSVRPEVAAEAVKRLGNGKVTLADGVYHVVPDATNVLEQAHRGWTKWQDGVMQYAIDAGVLSDEQAKIMRRLNQEYIPLKRVFAGEVRVGGGKGKGFGDTPQIFHAIEGSGRQIQHPLEAAMAQAEQIVAVSDKTRVARALVDMAESGKGLGKFVERLSPETIAKDVELKAIYDQLKQVGVDMSDADLDAIITVFSNRARSLPKENIVTFVRDGKREMFQIDPELYRALQAVDRQHLNPWMDAVLGKPTRMIRLGATGIKPGFAWWTNPIRDFWTSIIQTGETGYTMKEMLADPFKAFERTMRGYGHALGDRSLTGGTGASKEIRRIWATTGGELAQPLGLDKRRLRLSTERLAKTTRRMREPLKRTRKAGRFVMDKASQVLEATRDAMSVSESAPRLGEFEAVLRRMIPGWQPGMHVPENVAIEAANAAADVTLNFRRAGAIGRSVNQIYAFWNANMQGLSKTARLFKERPRYMAAKSFGVVTLPAMANWWMNKDNPDWQRLSAREKMMFMYISTELGPIRIPYPAGPFGTLFAGVPILAADSAYRRDPETFKQMFGETFEQLTPLPVTEPVETLPSTFRPGVQAYFNYDAFRNRDIVPQSLERYRTPANQASQYTTDTARQVGQILGVSPMKVDFLLNGYSGGLWYDLSQAADSVDGFNEDEPVWGSKTPFFGRAFKHPYPSDFIHRLYRERDEQMQIRGDWKAGVGPRPSKRHIDNVNRALKRIRVLREKRDKAKTRKEARRLTNKMDLIAQRALGLR